MKIDIGAGDALEDGWTSWDIKHGRDARDLSEIADASCDQVRAVHVLEHLPMMNTLPALQEWRRVLAPGGRLFVAVPDFMWCVGRIIDGTNDPDLERYIMGGQTDEHDFHYALFTESKLSTLLEMAGFERIARMGSEGANASRHRSSLNFEAFAPGA